MAAFKNKDNGTWYVQFRYTDWKGERQQKLKRGFATKREALEWEREFLMEKQADVNMTFESFVALYEKDIKPKLKLNTWLTKESIIKKKILPYFANRKLSEITAKDIIRWQNEIRELRDCHGKPLSKTYLKTVHNQLSAIFNHAARFYGLNINPARQAGNMGAEERKEMLFWTREEYTRFSEAMMLVTLDKRIAAQATLVEQLKKYKRGLHKLVFIKNRKPSWEKSALHDIASFCGGGTPSKDVSSYWDGEIGWISSSDIQEEWIDDISVTRRITKKAIDNSATKLCPEGTIAIVSRVGVGKVAIIPESLCTSQDFTNITSITGNTHYMAYQIAFRMKLEAMKTQGTSIKGVTADTIKSMVLDIPPLEEQKKIADMLTAFDSYIKRAVYELNLFLTMKKALLQQLFI